MSFKKRASVESVVDAESWDDSVAVRVRNLSKVYTIWNSPRARLVHPLLGAAKRVCGIFPKLRRIDKFLSNPPYRDFYALRDVSLEIKKGESWGFIGLNGSGKSTLLKIIAGNLRPTLGEVVVDGKVGIMDYSAGMNDDYTGRENIFMQAAIKGMSKKEMDSKMEAIEAFADIGDFIDQPTKTYSSGMKARLGFALMAHIDFDILISDEALAVGDAFFVDKCMNFIQSFLENGTFIFVSHSVESVLSLCQKAVWLEHGELMAIGDARTVADQYIASYVLDHSSASRKSIDESERVDREDTGAVDSRKVVRFSEVEIRNMKDMICAKQFRDARIDAPPNSLWAGESEVSAFNPVALGQGIGGAKILGVSLMNDSDEVYSHIIGGEVVTLQIQAVAEVDIKYPVVGFQFKNNLGQALFGDNTLLTREAEMVSVPKGKIFQARFRFQMPLLRAGEYLLLAAVGEVGGNRKETFHWHNDAITVQCTTSAVRDELVGFPMESISFEVKEIDGVLGSAKL